MARKRTRNIRWMTQTHFFYYLWALTLFIISSTVHPPEVKMKRNQPKPIGYTTAAEISTEEGTTQILLQEAASSQFVLSLKNGVVVNEGGIVTNTGRILLDTQTAENQHKTFTNNLAGNQNVAEMFITGSLVVMSCPGQENWYHFLLQALPRLKIVKGSGINFDRIFVNNLRFDFQMVALNIVLETLEIPRTKILETQGNIRLQAEILIVPSVPFIPSKGKPLPTWEKQFLRDAFLNKNENFNFTSNKKFSSASKIYISRAKANCRRISNEDNLTDYLVNEGFQVVYLEELHPVEQANLFNTAEIIVGVHGSGFANLIFAKPNTKVVEIDHGHGKVEPRSFYKQFSKIMGCSYYPFYTANVVNNRWEDDIWINMLEFENYLRKVNFMQV